MGFSMTTLFGYFGGYFFGNYRQKASIVCWSVAGKPHDAVVKFDTYRNLQWHRAVLPAIARLFLLSGVSH